ncbi:MAG: hypothetical protein QXH30_03235 [Candidatus Bilamarchaeaceae archaeon]
MKAEVIKRQRGCYLRLPEEFSMADSVEMFQLKPGYYLLSLPIGGREAQEGKPQVAEKGLSAQEQREARVLAKLASLGFSKRSPSQLAKLMSAEERKVLDGLVKAGKVLYVHNKKYNEGIYIIETGSQKSAQKQAEPGAMENQLFANGYLILEGSKDAQALSERLMKQKNSVAGIKGFDGKYYIVTTAYFAKASEAIARLGDEVTPAGAAAKCGLAIDGCKAVLKLLAERGDYLEKKGGIYIRV